MQIENGVPAANPSKRWPTLQSLGQAYVHRVLQRVKGNKTHAARILGIDRRSLYRWLKSRDVRVTPKAGRG